MRSGCAGGGKGKLKGEDGSSLTNNWGSKIKNAHLGTLSRVR